MYYLVQGSPFSYLTQSPFRSIAKFGPSTLSAFEFMEFLRREYVRRMVQFF